MKEDKQSSVGAWAEATGALIVLSVILCIAMVAAGGWAWFTGFLAGSASSWVQAIGSIIAILGAFSIANRQHQAQIAASSEAARQHRRQRLEVCHTVLERSCSVFESAKGTLASSGGRRLIGRELQHAKLILDGLPLFEVPDPHLVHRMGLVGQSLRHLEVGLDQIDEHAASRYTVANWESTAGEMVRDTKQTIEYCRRLIFACSTPQELVDSAGPEFARRLLERGKPKS